MSNSEIGRELSIGAATVKGHVSLLLGKLGVTNRVQAAVRAHQRGLVTAAAVGSRAPAWCVAADRRYRGVTGRPVAVTASRPPPGGPLGVPRRSSMRHDHLSWMPARRQ
ncbi:response regulator transcription factor [Streptomyces sp. T1317-0309]|nr:response regulator transcription factor [Streptomyces sp. T1317-0309]